MSATQHKWILISILSMVWGSSFILIKKSLIAFDPFQVAALRALIAALCMAPFFAKHFKRIERKYWGPIAVVALAGTGVPVICFPLAETEISSITAGILNSLAPLFTLLIGVAFFQRKTNVSKIFGVLIGLVGAILMIARKGSETDGNLLFGLFIIFGTMCYATSGNVIQTRLSTISSISLGVVCFGLLGPFALVGLFLTDFTEVIQSDPNAPLSLAAVSFLGIFGTAAASVLYFKLVQMTNAVFASMVAYLIPIVAVLLGLLAGEAFTLNHLLGLLLIMLGVYLSRSR